MPVALALLEMYARQLYGVRARVRVRVRVRVSCSRCTRASYTVCLANPHPHPHPHPNPNPNPNSNPNPNPHPHPHPHPNPNPNQAATRAALATCSPRAWASCLSGTHCSSSGSPSRSWACSWRSGSSWALRPIEGRRGSALSAPGDTRTRACVGGGGGGGGRRQRGEYSTYRSAFTGLDVVAFLRVHRVALDKRPRAKKEIIFKCLLCGCRWFILSTSGINHFRNKKKTV